MIRTMESMFFTLDKKEMGKIQECMMIVDREVISFEFKHLGEKFLVKKYPLEEIVKNRLKKEIDCVWVKMEGKPIFPIKCEMLVNCESGATILNLVGARYFFGFKKGLLQENLRVT